MLITNTTAIPSGLFTPIVVSGASLGGAYGLCLQQYVDKNIDPSAFALLGVGAMMAGIQVRTHYNVIERGHVVTTSRNITKQHSCHLIGPMIRFIDSLYS